MLRVWRFVRRCFTSFFLGAAFRVQNEKEKTEKSPPSSRKWVTDREKPAILSEMGHRQRKARHPFGNGSERERERERERDDARPLLEKCSIVLPSSALYTVIEQSFEFSSTIVKSC